jgi:hypothetical protein
MEKFIIAITYLFFLGVVVLTAMYKINKDLKK